MLNRSKPGQLDLTGAAYSATSADRSPNSNNWLFSPQPRKPTTPTFTSASSPRLLHSPTLGGASGGSSRRSGSLRSQSGSSNSTLQTLRHSVRFADLQGGSNGNNNGSTNNNNSETDVDSCWSGNSEQQRRDDDDDDDDNNDGDQHHHRSGDGQRRQQQPFAVNKRRKMADSEKEETINLQVEFEWVLHEEVHSVLKNLHTILVECAHRFPVPLYGNEGRKIDKFSLVLPQEGLKCIVTLTGDSITHADICYKLQRFQNQIQRVSISPESPWKLQQVQDAANHLQQAIHHIDNVDSSYNFKSSDEVLHILGNILAALQRGRTSLVTPKKKPIDELMKSRNMKSLTPNLPDDQAISFYLQSHKLIFAVYQLTNVQGVMRFDSSHAECSVPWLNEVLVLFTVALQLCQQLKDKISVFSQYKDFTVGSRSPSALSY